MSDLPQAFAEAESEYGRLRAEVDAGRLSPEELQAAVSELMIEYQGHWWMLGAQSGQWYRHDGTQWLMASSPGGSQAPGTIESAAPRLESYAPAGLPASAAVLPAANQRAHTANAVFLGICGVVLVARHTLPQHAQTQAHFYWWCIAVIAPSLCAVAGLLARTPAQAGSSPAWLAVTFVVVAVMLAISPGDFGGNEVEMIPLAMAAWFAMHGLSGRPDVGAIGLVAAVMVVAVHCVGVANRDLYMAWIGGGCMIWAALQFPR